MKKIAIFAAILSIGLSCMAQTGTGWQRIRAKQNFVDSVAVGKDMNVAGSLRMKGIAITAGAEEINALQGILVTATQLNHLAGISGNIQAQLNGKLAIADTSQMLAPYIARGDTAEMLEKYALTSQLATKENALGNPSGNGYILSSTTGGTRSWIAPPSGMQYPTAGIALSTGSAWAGSIANNSANWNTAYGWGNHASAGYAPLASPVFTGTPRISTDTVATRAYARANGMVYPAAGIPLSTGTGWGTPITNNSTNWNTAYTERRQWDGSATNLVPATGRTSLGATTVGSSLFTLANPNAIRYIQTNADNSVTAITGATLKTDLGLNNVTNESKSTMFTSPTFTGTVTMPSPFTLGSTSVTTTGTQLNYLSGATGTTGSGSLAFSVSPVFTGNMTLSPNIALTSGSQLNWNAGDVILTHSTDQLTISGGNLSIYGGLYLTGSIGSQTNPAATGWFKFLNSENYPSINGTSMQVIFAPINNPSLTGNVILPATTTIGSLSSTEIGYLAEVTSDVQTQLNSKEPALGNPSTDGYVLSSTAAGVRSWIPPGSGGGMVYPGAGIPVSTGTSWGTSITNNSANWNTAYSERRQWDGGATNLVAATGRTSLGATTVGSNIFTLPNPSAVRFLRINADNTVTALAASEYKTALSLTASDVGLGNVTNESKATMFSSPTFTGTVTLPSPFTIGATSVTTTGTQFNYLSAASGTTGTGNLVFSTSPTFTGTVTGTFSGNLTGNVTGDVSGNAGTVTGFTRNSGTLTLSGADALTLTTTAATNVTLPTTGTLATTGDINTLKTEAEVGIALADSIGYEQGNYLPRYSAEQLITSVVGSMGAPDFWVEAMQALGGNIKAVPLWCDMDASTSYTLVDGTIFTSAFYLTKDMLITGVRWALATQGDYTADNNNRIGLYKVTGTTATLVASTANDPDLWKSAAYAWQTLPFTQSYQAEKGIYYVSFIYNSSAQVTAPAIYAGESFTLGNMSSFLGNGVRVRGIFSAQTDLQASFNITHAHTQNASPMMILY
jgi:hypothetical protein